MIILILRQWLFDTLLNNIWTKSSYKWMTIYCIPRRFTLLNWGDCIEIITLCHLSTRELEILRSHFETTIYTKSCLLSKKIWPREDVTAFLHLIIAYVSKGCYWYCVILKVLLNCCIIHGLNVLLFIFFFNSTFDLILVFLLLIVI